VPYRELEKDGYFLPVLEVQAKYHRPAVYDDTVTVITTMREKPSLRITLDTRSGATTPFWSPEKRSMLSSTGVAAQSAPDLFCRKDQKTLRRLTC